MPLPPVFYRFFFSDASPKYNDFFYSLHSQQVPRMTTGLDISNFDAIDNYEKLFEDSYRKHVINARLTKETENFDKEKSVDFGFPSFFQV